MSLFILSVYIIVFIVQIILFVKVIKEKYGSIYRLRRSKGRRRSAAMAAA